MNKGEFIILFLFYLCSGLSILSGIYLLSLNINTRLHKIAFLFCASLSCWCFGVAQSLQAETLSEALSWRRIAVIGACFFYGFFIHFLIVITNNKTFQKNIMLVVIYGPVFLLTYFCALNEKYATEIYKFQKTDIGWVSTISSQKWYYAFEITIVCYFVFGLFLVFQWKKDRKSKENQIQLKIIFYTYVISLAFAILVQFFLKQGIGIYFHEIVPVIVTLPILSILLASKKYGFMKNKGMVDDPLFMDQFRTKIIHMLEVFFILAGVLFFIVQVTVCEARDFGTILLFSLLLAGFGFVTFFIEKFVKIKEMRIMGYAIILSIAIPIITFHFMKYYVITVWAFPFIILIAALLFYNTTILTMVSAATIMSLLITWVKCGEGTVRVNESDYIGRILIMGIGIGCIYYINQIYIFRLQQLSEKIKTQDFLFQVSSTMLHVKQENEKQKINEILNCLQNYTKADIIYIHIQSVSEKIGLESFYCFKEGKISEMDPAVLEQTYQTTWWKKQRQEKNQIVIKDTRRMEKEAETIQETLLAQGIKSVIEVPLKNESASIGFLRMDFSKEMKRIDDEFIQTMKILGNLLGEANDKVSVERQIDQIVHYDPLTNMPNRTLFGQQIDQEIKVACIKNEMFGIVFLDLDAFKVINDANGHHFGDKILVIVAEKLQKCFRKTDVVCRFGGDEFLILLNHMTSKADVEVVVKKIIKGFEEPLFFEKQEFKLTASIGIAMFPNDGEDKDTLIKNADLAMYQAKSNGRNQYVFCSDEMKEELKQNVLLVNHMYHAITKNEFEIYYQPQISLKNEQIIGMEALIRWNHPEFGMISPTMFIPLAEKTGIINELGYWILKNSCLQNKIWQDMGYKSMRLAVNVSVNQLLNSNFTNEVKQILEETGLNPCWLELEITESIAIQESEYIVGVLKKLKNLGVTLAIDDFGMEYSSLNRIKILPIDRIKIDMHFIKSLLVGEKDKAIVDVIIKLAKGLNLKIIAEGVENEGQLEYLKNKNCDEIQGFYFYKPLNKFELENILKKLE